MPKQITVIRVTKTALLLIMSVLTGCFETDNAKSAERETPLAIPISENTILINYPYYNDLELIENAELSDVRQKEWVLGNVWGFIQGDSKSPSWHLEFMKSGSGLGSSTEGTALLETVIHIPETSAYPTLSFWQELHLEKSNHSVVVEAKIVNSETIIATESAQKEFENGIFDWFVLRRFYESDNVDDYTQNTVDLTPYKGQSLRFRFRTVERSEKADEASGVSSAPSTVLSGSNVDDSQKDKDSSNNISSNGSTGNGGGNIKSNNKKSSIIGDPTAESLEEVTNSVRENSTDDNKELAKNKPKQNDTVKTSNEIIKYQEKPIVLWRIDNVAINERDSDNDGIGDIFEIRVETDPNDPESRPTDSNNDGIPDAINYVMGLWIYPCRYVGGGEFIQESIYNTEFIFRRSYESSAYSDCSSPWINVSKEYGYSLKGIEDNYGENSAKLNLELMQVTVTPKSANVTEALIRSCSKNDFATGYANDVAGVTCAGGISYPEYGVFHYDLIRQRENTLWLGDRLDEMDPEKRASRYGIDAAVKNAGS